MCRSVVCQSTYMQNRVFHWHTCARYWICVHHALHNIYKLQYVYCAAVVCDICDMWSVWNLRCSIVHEIIFGHPLNLSILIGGGWCTTLGSFSHCERKRVWSKFKSVLHEVTCFMCVAYQCVCLNRLQHRTSEGDIPIWNLHFSYSRYALID